MGVVVEIVILDEKSLAETVRHTLILFHSLLKIQPMHRFSPALFTLLLVFLSVFVPGLAQEQSEKNQKSPGEWIPLFDGKSLTGWRASENPSTFSVADGQIVVKGPRAHLFYEGPVQNHNFRNFELQVQVMTTPGSNSGIFFHTRYQEKGWPSKGYEVQVNNTHTDWRKTGSLYAVQDVKEIPAKDNEWFTGHIIVQGKKVTIKVNGKTLVEYTEPALGTPDPSNINKRISSGTFALQGHDPDSKVYYRQVLVRSLPD
jgi:hypothetical protein